MINHNTLSRITSITAAAAIAGGLLVNDTGPQGTCESPRVLSPIYKAPYRQGETSDPYTWKSSVFVTTHLPPSALNVRMGIENPTSNPSTWYDSDPISANYGSVITLSVGPYAVRFSAYVTAEAGSEACYSQPDITFGKKFYNSVLHGVFPYWRAPNQSPNPQDELVSDPTIYADPSTFTLAA